MRSEQKSAYGLSDSKRERIALLRRGISDLQHDLNKCQREVTLQLEEQMASLEPPLPQASLDAYDEIQRTSRISRQDFEACEEGIVELLRR